ncbi:MAG: hypothetical protein JXR96_06095 [Deltaproteobacteria bacterium]|nr:hypothetical protein [Deltaproteobacteria bacterium]
MKSQIAIRRCALILGALLATGCVDYGSQHGADADGSDAGDADSGPGGDRVDLDGDHGDPGGDYFDIDAGGDPGGDRVDLDAGGDEVPVCAGLIGGLADCPYQLVSEPLPDACPRLECMDAPCATDEDCPQAGSRSGDRCVLGNCVYCWQDIDCPQGRVCRAGRCTDLQAEPCANDPACSAERCHAVRVSEQSCPVCVCDSLFDLACEQDLDCQIISRHPYRRCVYGRCAECRSDLDCDWGPCLPPGLCFLMEPHPEALYGTWLVGWYGALNHYSYFRFEPDGTLRRGSYEAGEAWADDVPPLPCWPDEPIAALVGTWEPEVTESGRLIVQMSLNLACDPGSGWRARYGLRLDDEGRSATFFPIDDGQTYEAFRVPTGACAEDFSACQHPEI